MRSRSACALFILLFPTSLAYAASFDCKQTHSPREIAVCHDTKLSAEDTKLAAAYNRLLARLTPAAAGEVRGDQRAWLRYLDKACPAHGKGLRADIGDCLSDEYGNRLADFNRTHILADGHTLYARDIVSVLPNTLTDSETLGNNPGFGVGRFAFPQIDNPTKAEAAFNLDVARQAIQMTADGSKVDTFSTDPDGQIDISWSLLGQNSRLIVVDLQSLVMEYGAAHPSTTRRSVSFWLDRSRELQPGDLFIDGSHWRNSLVRSITARLRKDKGLNMYLWKDPKLSHGITLGLADTHNWAADRSGFSVTFGQYGVAAYVAGMPSARFTWKEMQPYLNPALKTETLPVIHLRDD